MTPKEKFESTTALLMICAQLAQSGILSQEEATAEARAFYFELKRILELDDTTKQTNLQS